MRTGHNTLKTRLIGEYNFENLMAGICVGRYFRVQPPAMTAAIENYIPENNRSQVINKNTNEIILDAYNANPTSMKAALENFGQLHRSNKVLILGDMLELGKYSHHEHRHIIETIKSKDFTHVYLIGDHFTDQADPSLKTFRKTSDFIDWLKNHTIQHSSVLIKGSRGLALEKIVDYL